ncbi:MAG TPA: hypothetical protein VFV38_47205 [Ktedonobacteraceae bacterium]|nr:hypothetical protein [Ktedonobacteraceae bacterium]
MSHSQGKERSAASRFSLQLVRTIQQSAALADPGCQRCQHCLMSRRLPLALVTDASPWKQRVPGMPPEKRGDPPCP